jgi:demethylmenaquinone methyltransferase/2-methoxy-6-polyprenyl-1,4-benzoquinol methylase
MAPMNLPTGSEKRDAVQSMFDRIAPRYDLLNRLVSLGLDQGWRRRALAKIDVGPGDRVVDLACGTGDLCEQSRVRGANVTGVDFAGEMLRAAQLRGVPTEFVKADAASLPMPDASVDVVTCGFALRNFVSLPEVFAEVARILKPGGRFAFIEVDRPESAFVRAVHSLYFDRFVPLLGGTLFLLAAGHANVANGWD